MADPRTEVIVREGGQEIARHVVAPSDYVIGRDPECGIAIPSPALSGRHAQLSVGADEVHVEDLGSGSGTFVDGVPVTGRTRVAPEQQIQLGPISISVRRFLAAVHDATVTISDVTITAPQDPGPTIQEVAEASDGVSVKFADAGKYEVGHEVARGGMGAVLQAKDRMIRRGVAMKVMLRAGADESVARFVEEAQITGQLEHPGIVPVYDLGLDANHCPYYTMKFVRGLTLRAVLEGLRRQDGKFLADYPLGKLLTIYQKVCDALAFAHARGVIHRDLKPDNIMIGDYGEVLVMDWGLAKICGSAAAATGSAAITAAGGTHPGISSARQDQGDSARTLVGDVMGTPTFMSPEQASGAVGKMDARSDIFALGAILYNILTLDLPFHGATVKEVLEKVRRVQVPAAAAATAGRKRLGHLPGGRVPASLSAVAHKAMARRSEERYQSVPELQRDIEAYQNGFATRAEHAGLAKQLALLVKRHKAMCGTACAAGLLIVGLTVWFVINLQASERKATHHAELATHNAQVAAANEQKALAEKEATRHALAQAQLALAEAAFRAQDGLGMQAALAGVPEDLRDSNWNYLLAQSDTSIATLRSHASQKIESAVPHPQKPGIFAMVGADGWAALVEARTGARLMEFQANFKKEGGDRKYRLALAPDGERLAIGRSSGGIVVYHVPDGKKLLEWDTAGAGWLTYSPDGRQLLEVQPQQISLWDATTGRQIWSRPTPFAHAVFHPNGRSVVAASRGAIIILHVTDGTVVRELPGVRNWVSALAVRPDGQVMWVSDNYGWVRCLALGDGHTCYELRVASDVQNAPIDALVYIPDGDRLVTVASFIGNRDSVHVWDAQSGNLLQTLLGNTGHGEGLSYHPLSGELVVMGSLMTKIWAIGQRQERWRNHPIFAHPMSFWSTEDWLFSDGGLLDLTQAEPHKHLLWKTEAPMTWATVSLDGRCAAYKLNGPSNMVYYVRANGQTVEEVSRFQQRNDGWELVLSPKGDRLLCGSNVVDPLTGGVLQRLERNGSMNAPPIWLNQTQVVMAVTVNGTRGLPGSQEQLIVCDTTTGKALRTAVNPSLIFAIAAAPDGQTIAEAGADRMVRLRDPATLAVTRTFRAHNALITGLAFHPHRPILATCSEDMTVKLWDLEADRLLEELRGPTTRMQSLCFSPSGRRLACNTNGTLSWIWEPDSLSPDAVKPQADGWEDLLGKLQRNDVTRNGNGWQFNSGVLVGPNRHFGAVALPGNFAQRSYQVRLKLRQLSAQDSIHIILPVADHHTTFMLDGYLARGCWSCLHTISDTDGAHQPGTVIGKVVKDSELHDLELIVHLKDGGVRFESRLDDQPLYQWSGPAGALGLVTGWPTLPAGCIGLGAHAGDWVVYAVKVKALEN